MVREKHPAIDAPRNEGRGVELARAWLPFRFVARPVACELVNALATEEALEAKRADPRYQRLIEATRAAAREGYEAVSMRRLAETCKVSMTTIYQFCSSKDQLIAEAHLDNMRAFRSWFSAYPPSGATAEERVRHALRSMTDALEVDETLTRTVMRALYATDPGIDLATRVSVGDAVRAVVDTAIGDADVSDRDAVIDTLEHVLNSVILGWLTERHDVHWVRTQLDTAIHVLLGPRTGS